ncbi:DUF6794 domain-containing protein [Pseudoalteromonas ruthenica]|uniref:DUF6794 domain-containing protein n=1 Tax=Pseudoalteromonas ruthenica TaxID=151081 RepID=UPI0012468EF2|nr:DUF6794 domain-containing protein [Pseudoalteromonas ruthenica]
MRILLIFCLSMFIFACAGQVKESAKEAQVAEESEVLPTTCQGAIEAIASELDEDSLKTLKETKREDLVMFHFSWGMGIRNGYGLWAEQSPIRLSCAEQVGEEDIHPDNASGIIMEGVWKLVNDNNM